MALLETRMDNHISSLNDFNLTKMIEVHAEGRSGGMVILWDHNTVTIQNFVRHNPEIHAMIEILPNRYSWLFSTIYANTYQANRNLL